MKNVILALAAFASLPAFAGEQYYCHGNFNTSPGTTLFVKALSHDHAIEGEKMEYLIVIRAGGETIFDGHVQAESEDVMLAFKSLRGSRQKLSGMIYMDELNQTWMHVGSKKMNFDCNRKED